MIRLECSMMKTESYEAFVHFTSSLSLFKFFFLMIFDWNDWTKIHFGMYSRAPVITVHNFFLFAHFASGKKYGWLV